MSIKAKEKGNLMSHGCDDTYVVATGNGLLPATVLIKSGMDFLKYRGMRERPPWLDLIIISTIYTLQLELP